MLDLYPGVEPRESFFFPRSCDTLAVMSISYIENLRESHERNQAYMVAKTGTYGAYHGLMDGIIKLSDFFYELNKTVGIKCYEETIGNTERRFGIQTESLHLSVFCTPQSYPAFSLHARVYKNPGGYTSIRNEHILETSDVDALIAYLYFIISSVDPERGKWIKL